MKLPAPKPVAKKKSLKEIQTQHSLMVAKLVKPGAEIVKALSPRAANLLHMAIGISGEVGELIETLRTAPSSTAYLQSLSLSHSKEEIGDLYFYIEGAYQDLKVHNVIKYDTEIPSATWAQVSLLVIYSAQFLDVVKKHAIYNKPLDEAMSIILLDKITKLVHTIAVTLELSQEDCLLANYDKLSVRYEGLKYSDEAAQKRADKREGE